MSIVEDDNTHFNIMYLVLFPYMCISIVTDLVEIIQYLWCKKQRMWASTLSGKKTCLLKNTFYRVCYFLSNIELFLVLGSVTTSDKFAESYINDISVAMWPVLNFWSFMYFFQFNSASCGSTNHIRSQNVGSAAWFFYNFSTDYVSLYVQLPTVCRQSLSRWV